jgi:hypothetical protein
VVPSHLKAGGDAHLQRLRAQRQELIEADEANSFAQLLMIEEKQALLLRAEQQQEQMAMKLAPDQAKEFHFDPLGLARRHTASVVCALFASAFPTPASADALDWPAPSYMALDQQKELEELLFLTVVALLCFSGESIVVLSQFWRDLHRLDADIQAAPGDEWIQKPLAMNGFILQGHFHPVGTQCYPVDMECEYCELHEEFSSYYGDEVWLCVNE